MDKAINECIDKLHLDNIRKRNVQNLVEAILNSVGGNNKIEFVILYKSERLLLNADANMNWKDWCLSMYNRFETKNYILDIEADNEFVYIKEYTFNEETFKTELKATSKITFNNNPVFSSDVIKKSMEYTHIQI